MQWKNYISTKISLLKAVTVEDEIVRSGIRDLVFLEESVGGYLLETLGLIPSHSTAVCYTNPSLLFQSVFSGSLK